MTLSRPGAGIRSVDAEDAEEKQRGHGEKMELMNSWQLDWHWLANFADDGWCLIFNVVVCSVPVVSIE